MRSRLSGSIILSVALVVASVLGSTALASDPFLGSAGPIYPNPVIPTFFNEPTGIKSTDLNEDGVTDLVVFGSSGIALLLGNGDCRFTRSVLAVFTGGSGVLGDFNEDNHVDLATTNGGNGLITILGNGDGTFQPPTTQLVDGVSNQSLGWGIAVGDFSENNHEDLVLGFWGGAPLAFFEGAGDGSFAAPVTFSGSAVYDIGAADFDENGDLDFIAGRVTPQVRLGAGNGTFADAGTFAVGTDPEGLHVGDLDGDTHADLVSADSTSDSVTVRLGLGDGTFAAATSYPVGDRPRFIARADVDGNGSQDLLVGYAITSELSFLSGNGDGTFAAEVRSATAHGSGPLLLSDFDGDGRLDLAVASQVFDSVTILRGHGDGSFDAVDPALVVSQALPPVPDPGPVGAVTSALGDVNHDGLPDVVLLGDAAANSIAVMLADGAGGFSTSATDAAGVGPSDVAIADLDNDTHADVIATNLVGNTASVLLGNGDGTFAPVFSLPVARDPASIAAGLFNADANVDLALLTTFPAPTVRILLGNGNATFSVGPTYSVGLGSSSIEVGDFDENGALDLVVLNVGSSDLSVLLGAGDGSFATEVRYALAAGGQQSILSVADADADGHLDLVVPYPGRLVLYGVGDGTFGTATAIGSDDLTDAFAFGDINGDGLTDLVGASRFSLVRYQLRDIGAGLKEASYHAAPGGVTSLLLDDVDGDGRADVVLGRVGGATVLLNVEPAVLNFLTDKSTLRWPKVNGATSYNVYRGLLSTLLDVDQDGLPDGGYGDCQNALDPDPSDLQLVDPTVPAPGSGYYYLVGFVDWEGERALGSTSAGLARVPALACP